ncbi:MAG: 2-C-methyl-D-erythritol 4-phosphate cytidylyltransferase [Candidatus Omnitrophota bacterium]|nr:MAG: 2-C-methyl-D-erythritol 4-phosphate cytidylyltransferase [Candidatus Omnitrophota bacterium]
MKKKVTAIIAAGGSGKRMGFAMPKPFVKIAGRPLLFYSLDVFEKSNLIDSVVLVVARSCLKKTKGPLKKESYKKLSTIVMGGSTRARSVYNGLCACRNSDIVLIHDVARPLLKQALIKRCVHSARKGINSLAAVPAKATIKNINLKNKYILSTPERSSLWEAQTPQVFDKKVLVKAYAKLGNKAWKFKDDASLVEACGGKVKVIQGDYSNIKITTKEDLRIAAALLRIKD